MGTLVDIACATIARYNLLPAGEPVVVLVSGGADSTALAHLLAGEELGTFDVSILHVNHLLRGDASDEDEAFVESLAAKLGVPYRGVRVDVAEWAESYGLNLEDAGRQVRYRLANEELDARLAFAGMEEGGVIATAHTLDDRIETFFMRALAGGGAGALASIPYRRGRIVRPLLDVERTALRRYLEAVGQPWREDASNADTTRLRSAVRHELLPAAERVNPAFRQTMRRTLGVLGEEDAMLQQMADVLASDVATVEPGVSVAFESSEMLTLPRATARRTIRAGLLDAFPEASRLGSEHVDALVDGLFDPGFTHDLPGGLRAKGEYDRLMVRRSGEAPAAVAPSLLRVPGKVDLGKGGDIRAEEADPRDLSGSSDSIVIDAGSIEVLFVDSVREGDRIRPLGMTGTRKLSDLLTDAKVPRRLRRTVPVVRDGEQIVWVAGLRMSDEYRVGPATRRAVRLTWQRG